MEVAVLSRVLTPSAAQEARKNTWNQGKKRTTLRKRASRTISGTYQPLVHFQEEDKKAIPMSPQPSRKCQNASEDLIFCNDKVRKSGGGDSHLPTFQDAQMHFSSKQGALLKTASFFQKARQVLLKASGFVLNILQSMHLKPSSKQGQ